MANKSEKPKLSPTARLNARKALKAGKDGAKGTPQLGPFQQVHELKMSMKRAIISFQEKPSRTEQACVESLEAMLPAVEKVLQDLEDANLSGNATEDIMLAFQKEKDGGCLQDLDNDLEFAASRKNSAAV